LVETWGVSWRIYLLLKKTIGIIPENYQNFGFKKIMYECRLWKSLGNICKKGVD